VSPPLPSRGFLRSGVTWFVSRRFKRRIWHEGLVKPFRRMVLRASTRLPFVRRQVHRGKSCRSGSGSSGHVPERVRSDREQRSGGNETARKQKTTRSRVLHPRGAADEPEATWPRVRMVSENRQRACLERQFPGSVCVPAPSLILRPRLAYDQSTKNRPGYRLPCVSRVCFRS
jgi:hypothetical protein